MMNMETILRYKKAAELELEGLQKLAEAAALTSDSTAEAAMNVQGDPVSAVPVQEEKLVLMLPEDVHTASLAQLRKVASEIANSEDPELKKLASELKEITKEVEKNAFVYEKDSIDPEPEMEKFFKDGVVEAPASLPKGLFAPDASYAVAQFVKEEMPYQKVNTGK